MRLLLDQGLPRSTVLHLLNAGIEAVHVGERSLATASDAKILDIARQESMIVVTLDADFHALLSQADSQSVPRDLYLGFVFTAPAAPQTFLAPSASHHLGRACKFPS